MRLALNLLWLTPMLFHAYQRGRIWLIFTDSDCATGSFQRKMADEEKKMSDIFPRDERERMDQAGQREMSLHAIAH